MVAPYDIQLIAVAIRIVTRGGPFTQSVNKVTVNTGLRCVRALGLHTSHLARANNAINKQNEEYNS